MLLVHGAVVGGKATGKRDEGRVGGGGGEFSACGSRAARPWGGCRVSVRGVSGRRGGGWVSVRGLRGRRPARPSERAAAAACEPNWLVWERLSRGVPADGAVFASMAALLVELLVECERRAQDGMGPCAVRRCEREAMDSFFKISERGSSVSAEVVGGITTFLAMAYVVAVNSNMMAAAGIPFSAALTSTCLGAAVATVAMGLIANRPIALASGMGLNAVVAFSICQGAGVDWRVAMAVVFVEGVAILLLVLCGLRTAIMDAIPADLRRAIAIGIGLFISFIGLSGSGLVVADPSTLIALGDLASPSCIVAVVSVLCAVVFHAASVKGGLILSIVAATAVGVPWG